MFYLPIDDCGCFMMYCHMFYNAGLAQGRLRLICNEEMPGVRVPYPAPFSPIRGIDVKVEIECVAVCL